MAKSFSKWGEKEFRKYLNGEGRLSAYDFIRDLNNGNIIAVIKSVAKSGMSRKVRFYKMVSADEHVCPIDISGFIARAGGFKIATDPYGFETDVILNGFGFDVIYACLEHVYNHIKEYTDLTDKSFSDVYRGYSLL